MILYTISVLISFIVIFTGMAHAFQISRYYKTMDGVELLLTMLTSLVVAATASVFWPVTLGVVVLLLVAFKIAIWADPLWTKLMKNLKNDKN